MSESCLLTLTEGIWNVQLFNALGQKVGEWNNAQKTLKIQKGYLSAGTYSLKAMDHNGKVVSTLLMIE